MACCVDSGKLEGVGDVNVCFSYESTMYVPHNACMQILVRTYGEKRRDKSINRTTHSLCITGTQNHFPFPLKDSICSISAFLAVDLDSGISSQKPHHIPVSFITGSGE